MRAGRTLDIDRRIIMALRDPANPGQPRGSFWTRDILHDLTALGGVAVLTLSVVVATIFLWVNGRRRHATVLLGTVRLATVVGELIKSGLQSPAARPAGAMATISRNRASRAATATSPPSSG